MSQIDAVYSRGVFQALEPVHLAEELHVRLSIVPANSDMTMAWLAKVQKLQAGVIARQGVLPSSAAEIASDRLR